MSPRAWIYGLLASAAIVAACIAAATHAAAIRTFINNILAPVFVTGIALFGVVILIVIIPWRSRRGGKQ